MARAICHDPATAERFNVALQDKEMGYETRRLRMKALKQALAKSNKPKDSSDDSSTLGEDHTEDTPETSSKQEEPVLDDASSSGSSLSSSSEMVKMAQKRRKTMEYRDKHESSSSEDDSPQTPHHQPKTKSKKKLDFSTKSNKSPEQLKLGLKCEVRLWRMPTAAEDYFI